MAKGRMLHRVIVKSKKFLSLKSDSARLLYLLMLPFTDSNGRLEGDPDLVNSTIYPRRNDLDDAAIAELLSELRDAGLILWYQADGDWIIEIVNFLDFQYVDRKKEAKPHLPGPGIETGEVVLFNKPPLKIAAAKPKEFDPAPVPKNDLDFDAFWAEYPKKASKLDAQKAWKQVKKLRPPVEEIVAKVAALKKTNKWTKDNGEFIPNPATFLRAGGWDDEVGAITVGKAPTGGERNFDL